MTDIKELIKIVPTKSIRLSKIVFDERNPNTMSVKQMEGLNRVIEKFGFAQEPWVNEQKDGTYMVIDGEHRIRMLQARGILTTHCKIFKVKYTDLQILRQVANKLRGAHDRVKDTADFKDIMEAGELEELSKIMDEPIEEYTRLIEHEFGDICRDNSEGEDDIPDAPKKPKSKPGVGLPAWKAQNILWKFN